MELASKYNPADVEGKWYQYWLDHKLFSSKPDGREPYTVVIPPPNVTGVLHMGHMLNNTIQDILVRRARMMGKNACWVPGTDHASIATEAKVVNRLAQQGIKKTDLTREEFLKHAWAWTEEHGGIILKQLRKLGASCDWDRTAFTMDETRSKSVIKVFVDLYNKGLIYRGVRMVNWDPKALTALSDEEVIYKEEHSKLYYLRYYVADDDMSGETGAEGEIVHRDAQGRRYAVVATTRPETIMGDTAMCINPADPKNQWLKGKKVIVPLVGRVIPVIEDSYVDIEFGTGCLKVTPAHDVNDYMLGEKYNLPSIDIFNDNGTLSEAAGLYVGMDRFDVRTQIEKDLDAAGLLEKVEAYTNKVGFSERTNVAIEPKLSMQWFLKMQHFADMALPPVMNDELKFYPAKYKNTYRNWLENIKDWCISRQLWWGHRIPVWYCDDCGAMTVSREDPTCCCKCGSAHIKQDEDVLDTWFSSALWPFSTLGWPDNTEDLKYFYPTNLLVTGYDIITFWVSRMITMGLEEMQVPPFQTVLIHGLVRDELGRKMSKSLGNGVDPLEVIDQYGADALRFSLVMGVSAGNDTRYIPARVESARNFANKIWNASRFVLMNVTEKAPLDTEHLTAADQWILSRFQDATRAISSNMEEGEFGLAADRIYDFAWSEFCDWYIELAKSRLNGDDPVAKKAVQGVLLYVLEGLLKLLHPFMPFLTEQVYKFLPGSEGFLMLKSWPEVKPELDFPDEEAKMEGVMEVIRTIRNLRAEMNVAAGKRTHLMLLPADGWAETLAHAGQYFQRLAGASETAIIESSAAVTEKTVSAVTKACTLYIPLGDLVDFEKEIARLSKELDNLHKEIARAEGKLNNPGFVSKAPAALVEQEKGKLALNQQKAEQVEKRIAELKESM